MTPCRRHKAVPAPKGGSSRVTWLALFFPTPDLRQARLQLALHTSSRYALDAILDWTREQLSR